MGSDFRDINDDGRPDLWHTAIEHETFPLYMNRGSGNYAESTAMAGLALPTGNMSGRGNGMFVEAGWNQEQSHGDWSAGPHHTEDGNAQWNQVSTAVGYASASDSRVHFGLRTNQRIRELSIRWPSGIRQQLRNLEVDRILTIEEPRQEVK
jgi:ASPIC and UnbV